MKTFILRHRVLLLLCGLTLFCRSGHAQTYKRVKALSEVRDGMRCVWIGRSRLAPDQYAVMQRQETPGTGTKNRRVVVVERPLDECITALPEDVAVFVAESRNGGWAFRDVANDGYLAYPTTKASSTNIPVYTLKESSLTSSSTYNSLFQFDFSNAKSCVSTKEKVLTTGTSGKKANFLLKYDRLSATIRLYETPSAADSLFLFRELELPVVTVSDAGDRTFSGDWMMTDLIGLDLSQARSVDFTKVDLPPDWPQADGGQTRLPQEYVWTYVRQGDGGNLPDGWPNVIEIGTNSRAVTPLRGDDRNECGPKYTFVTTESCGIDWYREADGGGWSTIGLPFVPASVTWNGPEGEAAMLERFVYKECADGGIVFTALADGKVWTARTAYLWRTEDDRSGTLCFHAGAATVYAALAEPETENGFHAALCRYDLDGEDAVYLLDAAGSTFVRAAAGSHIAPTRGYLRLSGVDVKKLHISEAHDVTSVVSVSVPSFEAVPVYTAGGMLKGWLSDGMSLPADWPGGLYITPKGKIWKP